MITASICTIGDEILIGQIVDTNSSHIAKALNAIGVKVNSMLSIGDEASQIEETISKLLRENDIVITTGGLGPTKDDITKLGIPAQDTTYSPATTSANGLMSAADKTKLDEIVIATDTEIDAIFAEVTA